jgi:hypothetical protein
MESFNTDPYGNQSNGYDQGGWPDSSSDLTSSPQQDLIDQSDAYEQGSCYKLSPEITSYLDLWSLPTTQVSDSQNVSRGVSNDVFANLNYFPYREDRLLGTFDGHMFVSTPSFNGVGYYQQPNTPVYQVNQQNFGSASQLATPLTANQYYQSPAQDTWQHASSYWDGSVVESGELNGFSFGRQAGGNGVLPSTQIHDNFLPFQHPTISPPYGTNSFSRMGVLTQNWAMGQETSQVVPEDGPCKFSCQHFIPRDDFFQNGFSHITIYIGTTTDNN